MEFVFTIGGVEVVGSVVLFLVLQWLLMYWFLVRLEKSVQHEYDKKVEKYKFDQLQRQKAESVARLFAHWSKYAGEEIDILDKKELFDYYETLSQMSLELSLWIKDAAVLNDVMDRLQNKPGAKRKEELIVAVRKLLLDDPNDAFAAVNVVTWPTDAMRARIMRK